MKPTALFNHKGGVGKITLVYHIAWMMAEQGKNVLAVDLDPQSKLSSMFLPPKPSRKSGSYLSHAPLLATMLGN